VKYFNNLKEFNSFEDTWRPMMRQEIEKVLIRQEEEQRRGVVTEWTNTNTNTYTSSNYNPMGGRCWELALAPLKVLTLMLYTMMETS
jgi:hypothetical protein